MRTFLDEHDAMEFLDRVPWGTAAGTTKDPAMALKYAQAGAKIVQFGSITWEPRPGNPGENFYYEAKTHTSINALGLPNRGFSGYFQSLQKLKPHINELGSELWVSISAGNSYDPLEYQAMAHALYVQGCADVVAANFSCPNVEVNGKRKPVVCYDIEAYARGVEMMRQAANGRPFAVKWAPITEASLLAELTEVTLLHGAAYIEIANTIGNCFLENEKGHPAISVVRGGLAGAPLIPLVSGMIQMVKPKLAGTDTKLIAIGGVRNGETAYHYLKQGADGFEFNTALSAAGGNPDVIQHILLGDDDDPGLVEILVERGL